MDKPNRKERDEKMRKKSLVGWTHEFVFTNPITTFMIYMSKEKAKIAYGKRIVKVCKTIEELNPENGGVCEEPPSEFGCHIWWNEKLKRYIWFCNKCGEYVTKDTGCSNPFCPEKVKEGIDPKPLPPQETEKGIEELKYFVDWQSYARKGKRLGLISIVRDIFEKINELIRAFNSLGGE